MFTHNFCKMYELILFLVFNNIPCYYSHCVVLAKNTYCRNIIVSLYYVRKLLNFHVIQRHYDIKLETDNSILYGINDTLG